MGKQERTDEPRAMLDFLTGREGLTDEHNHDQGASWNPGTHSWGARRDGARGVETRVLRPRGQVTAPDGFADRMDHRDWLIGDRGARGRPTGRATTKGGRGTRSPRRRASYFAVGGWRAGIVPE